MKKLITLIAMLITLGINNSVSQCTISDLKVRLVQINSTNCEAVFDLSWTQEINSGNKFSYLHLWSQSGFHTPAANWTNMYSNPAAYPKSADLINALATIVIDDNSLDTPRIGTVYHPDPYYSLPQLSGLSIVKVHLAPTTERMTVQNIKITLPSCEGAQTLLFDVWASQAANGKNVHCATQGSSLVINEVRPLGSISCSIPRQFQVFIKNNGPVLDNVTYDVHLDYPPLGVINSTDTVVFTSSSITLPANGTYNSGLTDYFPYSNQDPSSGKSLIIEVTVPLRSNTTTARIENGCGTLPVKFASFTVQQIKDKIQLKWQTASEQNNKGFEIQRKIQGSDFKNIAFIASKAVKGNSDELLEYRYDDDDNLAGAGQLYYRIKQVNLDGMSIYSETRTVKNNTAKIDVLIYPNPSNGFAKVIIPDGTGPVDIILNDASGKEIRRWNSVNNQLLLDHLHTGLYLLRVYVKETGVIQINKLIVL